MCSGEIEHYRRLQSREPVTWIDITREPQVLEDLHLELTQVLAEFHVVEAGQTLHKGAEGFLRLWSALPYYRWLALCCRGLRLSGFMGWLYGRFAGWHFRRRCAQGACAIPGHGEKPQ
jgi:hypothetical protein